MIFGVGTDLVSIKRIETALIRHGDRFSHRILAEAEVIEYAESKQPARFLAKRFAAKEAFSKAYGSGIGEDISWHDVRIEHDHRGKPLIATSESLAHKLRGAGVGFAHLSISDEADHALAFVVIETRSPPSN